MKIIISNITTNIIINHHWHPPQASSGFHIWSWRQASSLAGSPTAPAGCSPAQVDTKLLLTWFWSVCRFCSAIASCKPALLFPSVLSTWNIENREGNKWQNKFSFYSPPAGGSRDLCNTLEFCKSVFYDKKKRLQNYVHCNTFWCWERSPIGSLCSWSAPASQALVQKPSEAGRSSPRRQPCRWRDGWPPWSATEGRMCPARSCRGASEPRGGKAFEAPATLGVMVVFLFVSPFQFQSH